MLPYDIARTFLADDKAKYGMLPPSIWTIMNADGMRAIIHAMEQNKSFDTKKAADYLMNMKQPFPGITGPLQFAKDGNRIGSSYMTFEFRLMAATGLLILSNFWICKITRGRGRWLSFPPSLFTRNRGFPSS